jgi:hypothetical protein
MMALSVSTFEADPCIIAIEDIYLICKEIFLKTIARSVLAIDLKGVASIE